MANEISVSTSLNITKNSVTASGSQSVTATLAGNNYTALTQTSTGSAVVIGVGGVSGFNGWCLIKNIGTAVTGADDGSLIVYNDNGTTVVATLLLGEACLFKPAAAPYIKGATGTPDAAIVISEL